MYQRCLWLGTCLLVLIHTVCGQRRPVFTQDMNGLDLSENTNQDDPVYTLLAEADGEVHYAILNSNTFTLKNVFDGKVYLKRKLDYENRDDRIITVTLKATNQMWTNLPTEVEVKVNVLDANDIQPSFGTGAYSKSIPEDTPPGTTVMTPDDNFFITDIDGVNKVITVTCDPSRVASQHTDACDYFKLVRFNSSNNYWYGSLVLNRVVDYETRSQFQIPLVANDGENDPLNTVVISISNVQDTPPRWIRSRDITVVEEVPAETLLDHVKALDGDKDDPRPIHYEVLDTVGTGSGSFRINADTGDIYNTVLMDRESPIFLQGYVDINIKAREKDLTTGELGDDVINSTTTQIRITLEDKNDNEPKFDKPEYVTDLREDSPNDTPLNLVIRCIDPDQGINNNFIFTLSAYNAEYKLSDTGNQTETGTAQIRVRDTNLIDYETRPRQYVFNVEAQEFLTLEKFKSEAKVIVNIIDVNDNNPKFVNTSYVQSLLETAAPGFLIVTIVATDPDSGDMGKDGLVYGMTGDGNNLFQLNGQTGVVTVANCPTPGQGSCIDFDQKRRYVLTITARDENGRGRASTTTLTINILDVNDNTPLFINPNYTSYIEENRHFPNPEVIVSAVDIDTVGGPVSYTVIADQTGLWSTNVTGYIYANKDIIYTDTPSNIGYFVFQVQATDGIFKAVANVKIFVIDINDNTPTFPPGIYETIIDENIPGGSSVIQVSATDADSPTTNNGLIDYTITSGADGKFFMDRITGEIHTMHDSTFDYDLKNRYVLLVLAKDRGTPPRNSTKQVFINIRDINNKDPYFVHTTMRAEVYENVQIGNSVITVLAKDPDAGAVLKYYFTEPKSAISPLGNILDQNDHNFTTLFIMEEDTGIVRTNGQLDRDLTSILTYPMIVVDTIANPEQTGEGTLIITVLEYNDQSPYFLPFGNQTIAEEQPFGTFVMVLQARDQDDAIAEYQIMDNPHGFFAINFQTGTVSISRRIDFEVIESTYFTAMVFDTGIPRLSASTTVVFTIVNINDNSPKFQESAYTARIAEHSPTGTPVIKVSATDIDKGDFGVVRYLISNGNTNFNINNVTGEITVAEGANLDRETVGNVDIQLTAYDSPNTADVSIRRFATTTVYVYLDDINDNPPRFTQAQYTTTIVETIPAGTSILQVRAIDLDIGRNGRIAYTKIPGSGDLDDYFSVRPSSGAIQIQKHLLRHSGVYMFIVLAVDLEGTGPFNATAGIKITVLEAVNSYPEWVIPPLANMSINVLESQYLGMLVYDVHAKDADRGDNGIVDYGFYDNGIYTTATNAFMINSITGVIRAQRVYDREETDRYVLLLSAKDRGKPALETTRFLTVVILDVNDNQPEFPMAADGTTIPVEVQVLENTAVGYIITQLQATDRDIAPEAVKIYYYIISGNEAEVFSLNEDNGELFLVKTLDRETQSIFYLDVQATNNISDYSVITSRRRRATDPSIVTVKIFVGDTNDAKPTFTEVLYRGCVSTRSPVGKSILQVQAIDVDSAENIKYSFKPGSEQGLFVIDEITGIISNKILMSSTGQNVYNLEVKAHDSTLEDNADVQIFVTEPENGVTMVITQPASEVRLFVDQIQKLLESFVYSNNNPIFRYICFSSITDHLLSSGETSTLWSDVVITAVCDTCGPNGGMGIYSGSSLLQQLQALQTQNSDGFNLLYIKNLKLTAETENKLDSTPTLVVMVIIIVLIVCGLLFLLIACYCIKKSNDNKTALLDTRTERIQEAPAQKVDLLYDNYGYESENVAYAKVVKRHTESERPMYPEPELQLEFEPEYPPEPEPEPVIIDQVLTEFEPIDPSPLSYEMPVEMRIETTIMDEPDVMVTTPREEPTEEFRIEAGLM